MVDMTDVAIVFLNAASGSEAVRHMYAKKRGGTLMLPTLAVSLRQNLCRTYVSRGRGGVGFGGLVWRVWVWRFGLAVGLAVWLAGLGLAVWVWRLGLGLSQALALCKHSPSLPSPA